MRRSDEIRNRINEILNADPDIKEAIKEAAKDTFRLYKEYVIAGFTEEQAMQLTLVVLTCALTKGGPNG